VAWALNQVAADDPSLVDAALAAGERLQEASVAAASGRGDELRAAAADSRAATDAVVRAAAKLLAAKGAAARPALADTVRAAVLDADVAAELRAGRLTEEHETPGFGLSADAVPDAAMAAAGDRAAQRAAEAEERKRREAAEAEAAKLEH